MNANEIRCGHIIKFNNLLFKIIKTAHTQPGKGGAYMQCTMKCIENGQKREERFRSDEKIEKVEIFEKDATYLYSEDDEYTFLLTKTSELVTVNSNKVANIEFIVENMPVKIEYIDDEVVSVALPDKFNYTVLDAPAYIKGQSESSQLKSVTIQNKILIKTPQYIKQGDIITVRIEDNEFISRA